MHLCQRYGIEKAKLGKGLGCPTSGLGSSKCASRCSWETKGRGRPKPPPLMPEHTHLLDEVRVAPAGQDPARFSLQQRISSSTTVAVDRRTGETVVLKTVSTKGISSGARMRLEYESLRLVDIKSRWLIAPREVIRAADSITLLAPYVS